MSLHQWEFGRERTHVHFHGLRNLVHGARWVGIQMKIQAPLRCFTFLPVFFFPISTITDLVP